MWKKDPSHISANREPASIPMDKEAGAALLLTATSLDECKSLFQQQACATHPSAGGTLQEFNLTLKTFSAMCNGFATAGQLQWLSEAESSLTDLQALLRRLSPMRRREAIQQVPIRERQRLEKWMLRTSGTMEEGTQSQRRGLVSERSLCSNRRLKGIRSFRPCVHLYEGLYVQARSCRDLSMAVAAIGTLIIMRSLCRAQRYDPCRNTCYDFVKLRATDLQTAISKTLSVHSFDSNISFAFRTRFAVSKRLELSTPSRTDPQAAVDDWVVMIWAMDAIDKSFKSPTIARLAFPCQNRKRKHQLPAASEGTLDRRTKLLKLVSDLRPCNPPVPCPDKPCPAHGELGELERLEGHAEIDISGSEDDQALRNAPQKTDDGCGCQRTCRQSESLLTHIHKAIQLCSNKASRHSKLKPK